MKRKLVNLLGGVLIPLALASNVSAEPVSKSNSVASQQTNSYKLSTKETISYWTASIIINLGLSCLLFSGLEALRKRWYIVNDYKSQRERYD